MQGKSVHCDHRDKEVIKCEPEKVICLSHNEIKVVLTYFFIKATAEMKRFLSTRKYCGVTTEINGMRYYNNRRSNRTE